ncbi:hypothetical protein LTSEGIV_5609 [Salmonella enterica subsp. enterica serovar Give str. S5-487]|nr:hypothetical protein LTSEGIV_5609 [Salmonella enterica subsp. enterica serovar Give str. S5-487]
MRSDKLKNKPDTGAYGHSLTDREAGNNHTGMPGLLPANDPKTVRRF